MADERVTLALNGDVPIDQFATTMHHWAAMVAKLTRSIGPGSHSEWIIEDLQPGSATTTIRGESDNPAVLLTVRRAIVAIARDIEAGGGARHSPQNPARAPGGGPQNR